MSIAAILLIIKNMQTSLILLPLRNYTSCAFSRIEVSSLTLPGICAVDIQLEIYSPACTPASGRRRVTPVLPHHRTCGSASGGSSQTLESMRGTEHRHQPHTINPGFRERRVHVAGAAIPPRAGPVGGRAPRTLRRQSRPHPVPARAWGPGPLPLEPQHTAQAPSQPPDQRFQTRLGLDEPEVRRAAAQQRGQRSHGRPNALLATLTLSLGRSASNRVRPALCLRLPPDPQSPGTPLPFG